MALKQQWHGRAADGGGGMYDKEFLNSWKEVAQYVGRSERTIQRWEREFGFPVHRPAGKLRSSVIAVTAEIDEWIMNSPASRSTLRPFPSTIPSEGSHTARPPNAPLVLCIEENERELRARKDRVLRQAVVRASRQK